jgi:hypothetical protein
VRRLPSGLPPVTGRPPPWGAIIQGLSHDSPFFRQAPIPGEWAPCLGSAKPIACDATAESALYTVAGSWTMERREDGTTSATGMYASSRIDQCWLNGGPARAGPGLSQGRRPALVPARGARSAPP